MIDRERFQKLVEKHLDNTLTLSEEKELETYYNNYGEQIFPSTIEQGIKKSLYQNILDRKIKGQKSKISKINHHLPFRAAAAVTLILVLGFSFLFISSPKYPEQITVTTQFGERKEVVLPDSSVVTLNSGSSISYPKLFIGNKRQVSLKGEAFFEVAHNPEKPFLVTASTLKTWVLGTSFNIRAYENSPSIKISLETGSIRISSEGHEMATLKPDEQLSYHKVSSDFSISNHETDKDISWLDNVLELDDHSLEEAQQIVERWFNVKLQVTTKENTKEQSITGKFIDPTLEETLKSLELLTGSKITYKNQVKPLKFHSQ